jgi:hypothetical protein
MSMQEMAAVITRFQAPTDALAALGARGRTAAGRRL